jgi:hypothetical protein
MSEFGQRIAMFRPDIIQQRGGDVLGLVPLGGIHPEVNRVPIGNTGTFQEIGSTYIYSCPFTGRPRTLWVMPGSESGVLQLMDAFAKGNDPVPEAEKFIRERSERLQLR